MRSQLAGTDFSAIRAQDSEFVTSSGFLTWRPASSLDGRCGARSARLRPTTVVGQRTNAHPCTIWAVAALWICSGPPQVCLLPLCRGPSDPVYVVDLRLFNRR